MKAAHHITIEGDLPHATSSVHKADYKPHVEKELGIQSTKQNQTCTEPLNLHSGAPELWKYLEIFLLDEYARTQIINNGDVFEIPTFFLGNKKAKLKSYSDAGLTFAIVDFDTTPNFVYISVLNG